MNENTHPRCVIVTEANGVPVHDKANTASRGHVTAYWTGFVYNDHAESSTTAVERLLEEIAQGGDPVELSIQAKGSFFITIVDEQASKTYTFVDESELYSAYRGPRGASTSFLQLCRHFRVKSDDFSREAMVEFLHLGNIYFRETLVPSIKKIRHDEVLIGTPGGTTVATKKLGVLSDPSPYPDLIAAMKPMCSALANERVSVDLTGGFDSRMIASLMFANGVEFEAALSGRKGSPDNVLGEQAAEALGVPYHYSIYDNSSIPDELPQVLEQLDGLGGLINVNHRLCQLQRDRAQRGITMSVKGSSGEMFKDFFWTHDFPFYGMKKPNFDRLCRTRLEFEYPSKKAFSDDALKLQTSIREHRLKRMRELYERPTNTQTNDHFYYYERVQTWNSRTITSTQYSDVAIHLPLAELGAVQFGYALPILGRCYNRHHRKMITQVSPATGRAMTTDGTTASAKWNHMLFDSLGYTKSKGKKLLKKLSQKFFNRTLFEPVDYRPNQDVLDGILTTQLSTEAIETLKSANLLRPEATIHDLQPRFREHAISLGWTIGQLS